MQLAQNIQTVAIWMQMYFIRATSSEIYENLLVSIDDYIIIGDQTMRIDFCSLFQERKENYILKNGIFDKFLVINITKLGGHCLKFGEKHSIEIMVKHFVWIQIESDLQGDVNSILKAMSPRLPWR